MEPIAILTDCILPNPWQPREREDPEHIKKIALSIAQDGLMQVPVGRWVYLGKPIKPNNSTGKISEKNISVVLEMGWKVELAFGHSRLAAYKWLEENLPLHPSLKGGDYSRMPVLVRELSDEEMFRLGVGENLARKDLNPVEEARAMARFRDEFGKTSAEIGALFGLAESSVRNKMRLLGLPAEIQAALSEGRLSEGGGRELLRLFDLPAEIQKLAERYQAENEWHNKSIVQRALEGLQADQLRMMISRLIERSGKNLHSAEWKWDEAFDQLLNSDIRSETCKGCGTKLTMDGKTYCPDTKCYYAKRELWIKRRLAAASLACGIAMPEDLNSVGKIEVAREVRESGCQNLRVVYDPWNPEWKYKTKPADYLPGFPDVRVVCGNRNSICTCANGLAIRKAAERSDQLSAVSSQQKKDVFISEVDGLPVDPDGDIEPGTPQYSLPKASPTPPASEVVTAEELREAARQEKVRIRQEVEEIKTLREEFARRVRDAALNLNRWAFYQLVSGHETTYRLENRRSEIGPVEESAYRAALGLAERTSTYYSNPRAETVRKELNKVLAAMEIREIDAPAGDNDPVYVPVEADTEPVRLGWVEPDGSETVDRVLPGFPGQKPGETLADYFERTGDSEGDGFIPAL